MKPTEKAIHIHIDGISCINCCNKIEKALYGTDGVISVNLSYETQIADIVYNPTILSIESIYFR
ncbi:heavy-metal-associated domain-containing protein [Ruminococcus sp.]|uniref:heavy-metal-associated domain-containing protein n=1 Tax=Ruminococcus sp. TaxID=41978 RepID=UPI00262E05D7|nr:heavy-metal-associated domain-containing protein [Ruminococcus sp.]MDD6988618.1 heavy-metal-associated domain-containing protein [Ruminococcus sp.]MDY6201423.1 heavy-metal-associated domain-containing protein [Ruminococcus sp.]